jgi:CRISPR-associated protein Csd2
VSKSNAPFARAVGLLVIEVVASNPNGDPDRESDPRHRPDGHGEISPVSFKRKVRDVVENKEGAAWRDLAAHLKLKDEGFGILESRGRDRRGIEKELKDGKFQGKYWDGRVFGNTFLEEGGPDTVKAGVVQFGVGLSVAPVIIDRRTLTNKAGVESGKDRGMAPLAFRVVQHGVYVMPFFVNPNVAHKTGCTSEDIKLLLRVIPTGYDLNKSLVRPDVRMRHAWYVEHKHVLGSCSDFALIEALTPKRKGDDPRAPSTRWDDYDAPAELPKELAAKVEPLRDLVEESHAAVRA